MTGHNDGENGWTNFGPASAYYVCNRRCYRSFKCTIGPKAIDLPHGIGVPKGDVRDRDAVGILFSGAPAYTGPRPIIRSE